MSAPTNPSGRAADAADPTAPLSATPANPTAPPAHDRVTDDTGASASGQSPVMDWLAYTWAELPERSREVLGRRIDGDTLDLIGQELTPTLTRERVRQIESRANGALLVAQAHHAPTLRDDLETATVDYPISTAHALDLMGTAIPTAGSALLVALGYRHPRGWARPLRDHWTTDRDTLLRRLRRLVALAPLTDDEMGEAAGALGLPEDPTPRSLLDEVDKLERHELGWVRTARRTRDLAFLWLRAEGEPRPVADIARAAGCADQAARENMRRDPAFAQLRPEGTWALTDWRSPGAENRYSSALDVLIETLRDLGPLGQDELRVEVQRRYPVTDWRVTQCLSSHAIGRTPDGRWDLAERGAVPVEDTEPTQPDTIRCVGTVVGVTLPVNHDLLRGSGLGVSRWLTWRLGLRTAPTTREFQLPDDLGTVRVTRSISNSQVSSLRRVAQRLGLVEGCDLTLLLHVDDDTATVRHTCAAHACPRPPEDA
ncbi:hypothetical protein GCM10028771_26440 [Nocardioides marmoraquaticus]